ncbi:Maf family protein [Vineibacter terrae]|uniref:Maf family protein n=1 Tax=Vineibacter terrae TaxID=2586908 RepID=UPI001C49AB91|nr:Maf family protein [Vineibacter terrae]
MVELGPLQGAGALPVVLASTSIARRALLQGAGIAFEIVAPGVDEDAVKRELAGADAASLATALADRKALAVSARRPGAVVIGGDSTLACDGRLFDKPADIDAACEQLRFLRGRVHELQSAVSVARDGEVVWRHIDTARLAMRPFSDDFLTRYVDASRDWLTSSVGAYRLEGTGAQLFERIDGDYFTILGLPLLPLLAWLRSAGVLRS